MVLKPVIVTCDRTDCGSLFHSVGEALVKPCLTINAKENVKYFKAKGHNINQSINQLSRCLISVSTDSKAHHPIRKA